MKILVTGAGGFIGKNLVSTLRQYSYFTVLEYHHCLGNELLEHYCSEADFVFNLAGVNRSGEDVDFYEGNKIFLERMITYLKKHKNYCPIVLSSSIQAILPNSYGMSKLAGEKVCRQYSSSTGARVYIYRLPNVFGKWCRPNYNSVVATFCHNIARGIPIEIHDANAVINLVYIDDVVNTWLDILKGVLPLEEKGICYISQLFKIKVGYLAERLNFFAECRKNLHLPECLTGGFDKKLYNTYLSYLPGERLSYPLLMHSDDRGSFTEMIRTANRGQFSVNVSRPNITKGNHWHSDKNEKFIVVSGKGIIRLRKIGTDEVFEYCVSGDKIEVVDIPPGYTHNISNIGDCDMVTFMWCDECYNKENPDTYYEEV